MDNLIRRSDGLIIRLSILLTLSIYATYAQTPPVSGRWAGTSVPGQVRSEGRTERLGDIILQCSGSNPGAVLSGNLSVFLPVGISNRLDSNSINLTHEAVLSVDYGSGLVPTGIAGQISNQIIQFNGLHLTLRSSRNLALKISHIPADVNQLALALTPRPLQAPP